MSQVIMEKESNRQTSKYTKVQFDDKVTVYHTKESTPSNNIKLVKKAVAQACTKTEEIALLFPKHWEIKLHPESDKLSKDIFDWLKEVGLCKTADEEKLVTAFSLQCYGGYCQPEGDYK